jgi:hypothetical protein
MLLGTRTTADDQSLRQVCLSTYHAIPAADDVFFALLGDVLYGLRRHDPALSNRQLLFCAETVVGNLAQSRAEEIRPVEDDPLVLIPPFHDQSGHAEKRRNGALVVLGEHARQVFPPLDQSGIKLDEVVEWDERRRADLVLDGGGQFAESRVVH